MSRITIEPNKPDSPKPTLTASPLSNNGLRHVARKSTSMSNQIHINRNRLSLQTQAYSNQPTQISTQNMTKNAQLKPNLNGEKMMSQLGTNGSNGSRLAQNSALTNTANSPDSNQKQFRNKMVSCKPFYQSKATECYPMVKDASTQIDLDEIKPSHSMVPVPVPVNVPIPMCMYQAPMPVPLLVPVPVPVPVFIPTTKKTYDRVQRRIKKLRKKLPSDPYEFEILLYAEKLARQEGISGFEDSSDGESETEPSASNQNQDIQDQLQLLQESDSSFKWTIGVKVFNTWLGKKIENVKCVSKLPNDLLKLKNEEINLLLAEFLSEVRKPNGEVYAPESIYYIGLGIQHYLQEKGRVESIFFDSSLFDEFQEALNEIAMRYKIRIDGDGQVASRIEEEILWETKQLGAYSPFVLLNTILYFNTKYFFLDKVEAHKKLSFANVKKHAKRNIGPNGEDYGKTVFLRYYPDFHGIEQVIYEQGENYENPLRCPVELYNFYISKCPESVKNRNDIFYLMPEKTSLPSSPVWFSSQPISDKMLDRMLNRIKMVKEVNELLLAAAPSTAPLIVQ
ncbi:Zinc finger MYM-type 4 [Brachionus plicatilis]|uniref:Zinc finger MYM-type 4 n=1 Tax=Brachionus plicatilis TaxID=10195 RepID=A0A3M7S4K7_BRAPC|nr:Zinc finger MYM-type 4 [Brachionus plicatilis]